MQATLNADVLLVQHACMWRMRCMHALAVLKEYLQQDVVSMHCWDETYHSKVANALILRVQSICIVYEWGRIV